MLRHVLDVAALAAMAISFMTAQVRDEKSEQGRESAPQAGQLPLRLETDQFLQEYDKNKDGFLGRDELPARLRDRFAQLDKNKDGKLSRDELQNGAAFLQPQRRPADVLLVLVEMSDCDECCLEELQHIYDTIRRLDKDGDGKLSANELKVAREAACAARVDHLLKDLDGNKDGKLSKEEVKGQLKKDFDRLDANKDGAIDREELLRAASERPNGK